MNIAMSVLVIWMICDCGHSEFQHNEISDGVFECVLCDCTDLTYKDVGF